MLTVSEKSLAAGERGRSALPVRAASQKVRGKEASVQESENRRTILAYVAAFNGRDTERLRQIHTQDAVVRGVLGWGGIDEVIPIWQMLWAAFAIELEIEDVIEEADRLSVRYTERGRSVGRFREQEPTGGPTRWSPSSGSRCRAAESAGGGAHETPVHRCGRWDSTRCNWLLRAATRRTSGCTGRRAAMVADRFSEPRGAGEPKR